MSAPISVNVDSYRARTQSLAGSRIFETYFIVPATYGRTRFTSDTCRLVGVWQCLASAGTEYEISDLGPTDK